MKLQRSKNTILTLEVFITLPFLFLLRLHRIQAIIIKFLHFIIDLFFQILATERKALCDADYEDCSEDHREYTLKANAIYKCMSEDELFKTSASDLKHDFS